MVPVHIIVFCLVGLLLGGIINQVKKKSGIPYSPLVLATGIVLGLLQHNIHYFGDIIILINDIEPHIMLIIFIPALVFESAYNTDSYVLYKSKWQILMLAGPGVLMSAFGIALLIYGVLGYHSVLTFT